MARRAEAYAAGGRSPRLPSGMNNLTPLANMDHAAQDMLARAAAQTNGAAAAARSPNSRKTSRVPGSAAIPQSPGKGGPPGAATKVSPSSHALTAQETLGAPTGRTSVLRTSLRQRVSIRQRTSVRSVTGSVTGSMASAARGNPNSQDEGPVEKFGIVHEASGEDFRFILDWNNPYRRVWDVFIVCAVIYLCFTLPIAIAFIDMEFSSALSTVLDIMFWIDIVLNFRTGFIHHGEHVKNPKEIAKHYMHTWFFIDILASIPFEYILKDISFEKTTRKSLKILKWLKIPKLLRVGRIFKYLKDLVQYYRLFVLSSMAVLFMHMIGCVWMSIAAPCDSSEQTLATDCTQAEMWNLYLLSLRISFMMIFQVSDPFYFVAIVDRTIAEHLEDGGAPSDSFPTRNYSNEAWSDWTFYDAERRSQTIGLLFLTIFGMVLGFTITVNLIAEAVVFAMNRMSSYYLFFNKVNRIKEEMQLLHVPHDVQYRVSRYYDYLWINKKMGLNDPVNGLLCDPDLSRPLRKDLVLHLHGPLLSQLSLFKDCSEDCLFAIAIRLKTHVYLPGDIVFHKGDVARELFLIRKGIIAVNFGEIDAFDTSKLDGAKAPSNNKPAIADDHDSDENDNRFKPDATLEDSATLNLMGPGSFFGEIALLTSMPRSCSVFSKTVSELNELSKEDFEKVMEDFPELSEDVASQVLQLYPGLKSKLDKFVSGEDSANAGESRMPGGSWKLRRQGSRTSSFKSLRSFGQSEMQRSIDEAEQAHNVEAIVEAATAKVLAQLEAHTAEIISRVSSKGAVSRNSVETVLMPIERTSTTFELE